MTGISVIDTERTLVTYTTRAVLAFHEGGHEDSYNCIGCGRCRRACPQGLDPRYIRQLWENHYPLYLRQFDPQLCIGCGTCSYMCPSRLPVSQSVLAAKASVTNGRSMPAQEVDDFED